VWGKGGNWKEGGKFCGTLQTTNEWEEFKLVGRLLQKNRGIEAIPLRGDRKRVFRWGEKSNLFG